MHDGDTFIVDGNEYGTETQAVCTGKGGEITLFKYMQVSITVFWVYS